jgi:EmrB/QacA subfamily drug resistance transporter
VSTRPGYLLPMRQTVLAFAGVLLGMLVAILNQTIIATALPTIVGDLGGVEHYSWVFSAYMLGSTVTVPVYGRLSDIYGRRVFFAFGLVVFMAGAIVGAASSSMGMLIAARAVQGLGAGALIPLAIITIGDLVPPSERGRWQGLTGAVIGVASVLGPFTGGWIVDNTSWRWVFLVSLPIGLVALAVGLATLRIPPHPEAGRDVDYKGAALLVTGVSAILLATVWGGEQYPWGSGHVIGLFAGGALLLALFVAQELHSAHPLIAPDLFRDRVIVSACLAGFSVGVAMFGAIMFVPLFVQGALGASATSSGAVLTPLMLALMLASVGSGQIITRTGRYRWALLSGPIVMAAGFIVLASLDETSRVGSAVAGTIVLGLGLGLLMQNLVLVVQNAAPARALGAATGATQFFRQIGGTLGVTVMGAILAAGLPAGVAAASGEIGATGTGEPGRAALAHAIHPVFMIGIPLMAVTLALVALVPERPLRRAVRIGRPLVERVVAPTVVALPVRKGEQLGVVRVYSRGRLLGERPLVAAESVSAPGLGAKVAWYAKRTLANAWGLIT